MLQQMLLECDRFKFCKNIDLFQTMQAVIFYPVHHSLFSFRKITLDEMKFLVRECQLPILLVLIYIHHDIKMYVLGVFPSFDGVLI